MDKICLECGYGGWATNELVNNLIFDILYEKEENVNGNDGAVLSGCEKIAVSTDSFVVSPLFFGEKSIGVLCIAGSVNDVLTCGAEPKYITLSFIIEENFEINDLKKILWDIKEEAKKNGVKIVTGDTKVVPKGMCDGIYINTACVGYVKKDYSPKNIEPGDRIILTGTLGDHEACLTILRNNLPFESSVKSDAGGLCEMLVPLLEADFGIKAMRDPTRGGLAATLNELSGQAGKDFLIYEKNIPVNDEVRAFCEITGLDKFTFANEGKMLIFVKAEKAEELLDYLRSWEKGRDAAIIGEVCEETDRRVWLKTLVGKRVLPMPRGSQLPRIC
ncbi:MAG: hydrogenase expression/formation protein HypE [Armatimonadetes bacterium]|nr:hydrogenase expression/formation protein HypE [Candidatus Hippobium faecium]